MTDHIIEDVCSCKHCHMLDVMFGDPLLNDWEKRFVKSVASYGWRNDYSPKQKTVIERTFNSQCKKYKNQA